MRFCGRQLLLDDAAVYTLSLLFALFCFVWWYFDNSYPIWDAGSHVHDAVKYAELLKHPKIFSSRYWHDFLTVSFDYPLTQHLISGIVKCVLGSGKLSDAFVNSAYVVILSLSVAKLTHLQTNSSRASIFAIILINSYSIVAQFSHTQMLDFGTIALVALGLASLCNWVRYTTNENFVVLCLCLMLGATAKQTASLFLILPCLLLLSRSILERNYRSLLQLVVAGSITTASLLLWLLPNLKQLRTWGAYLTPQASHYSNHLLGTLAHLQVYIASFPGLMSSELFWLFVVAMICFRSQKWTSALGLLFLSSISGIVLTAAMTVNNPEPRYIMPALLYPAVITGSFLWQFWDSGKFLKRAFVCFSAFVALAHFFFLSYVPYPVCVEENVLRFMDSISISQAGEFGPPFKPTPEGDLWGQKWLMCTISSGSGAKIARVNVVPNTRELSVNTLKTVALYEGMPFEISNFRRFTLKGDAFEFTPNQPVYFDWFVVKTGSQGIPFAKLEDQKRYFNLIAYLERKDGDFQLYGRRKIFDKSELLLFKRKW